MKAASPLQGFGSIVFAQLRYLVQNINKKNQKASVLEIAHLLWLYGESAFVYLLICLVEEIDFRDPKLQKDQLKVQLLTQEFSKVAARPNFVSLFCEIIAKAALPTPLQEDFLHAVAKAVKATSAQQLAMGLGLAQCSDQAIRAEGSKFLRTRLNDLTAPPSGGKEAVAALPEELGHALIFYLERRDGFDKQRAALMKSMLISAHYYGCRCPPLATPRRGRATCTCPQSQCCCQRGSLDSDLQRPFTHIPSLLVCAVHPGDTMPLTMLPLMHAVDAESIDLNSRTKFDDVARRVMSAGPAPPLGHACDELAALMHDLGYSCCASSKTLGELLAQFEPPDARCVGAVVGMMAATVVSLDDSLSLYGAFSTAVSGNYQEFDAKFDADKEDAVKALTAWNLGAFVEAVRERSPSLDWAAVFEHLHIPTLGVSSSSGLTLLTEVHRKALGTALPARCLLGDWSNQNAQLQLLSYLLTARGSADVDLGKARRVKGAPEGNLKPDLTVWLCADLTGALLRLSACGFYLQVQKLFAEGVSGAPQVLLAALVQMAPVGSRLETQLQCELLEQLMPRFLSGDSAPSTNTLLKTMWEMQPAAVMRGMAQLHAAQPQSLLRLLDIAQSFGALEEVLRLNSYAFTLDLAAVAQRKDLIQLEPWVLQNVAHDSVGFVNATMSYLRDKMLGSGSTRVSTTGRDSVNVLSMDAAAGFFRGLMGAQLPPSLMEDLGALYRQCVAAKPKLQNLFVPGDAPKAVAASHEAVAADVEVAAADAAAAAAAVAVVSAPSPAPAPGLPGGATSRGGSNLDTTGDPTGAATAGFGAFGGTVGPAPLPGMPGGQEIHFAHGIEEEANSYFQKIYTGASTIDDVITMLKRFQMSSDSREQQVYACMVHNLFDEYRYFPKYPDKPLRTTALLFGALVQHGLVSHITLGMFLRYVLEALRKPPGSKMCKFGAAALESFRARLTEWPQYCQHLIQIPHFQQVLPSLVLLVESAAGGRGAGAPTPASTPPGIGEPNKGPPGVLGAGGGPPGLGSGYDPIGGASEAAPASTGGSAAPSPVIATSIPPSVSAPPPFAPAAVLPGSIAASFTSAVQPGGVADGGPQLTAGVLCGASSAAAAPPGQLMPPPPTIMSTTPTPDRVATPGSVGATGADMPAAAMAAAFSSTCGFSASGTIDELSSAASEVVVAPPDSVQDRIGFLLNNMQASNVQEQAATLKEIIEGTLGCVQWFAQYLVVKRVSLEPNFHTLCVSQSWPPCIKLQTSPFP